MGGRASSDLEIIMEIKSIFPSIISSGKIPNFDQVLNDFKTNTENITSLLQNNVFEDNIYSTNKVTRCLTKVLEINTTKEIAEELMNEYKSFEGRYANKKLRMIQSWFNLTPPGGFQDMHTHEFEELCGCFYLDVPPNSGDIEFAPLVEFASKQPRVKVPTYTGMYVFFPGYLLHRVTYNRSSAQRMSFCFNFAPE